MFPRGPRLVGKSEIRRKREEENEDEALWNNYEAIIAGCGPR